MYNIEFYANRNGQSEILNFLEALRTKSKTSKDARIQYNQIVFYIDLLAKNGSNLPINDHEAFRRRYLGAASGL